MGIHPAPSYASIYLAKRIDKKIKELGMKYGKAGKSSFILLEFQLDEIMKIFTGTTKQLHKHFNEMNCIHPTLKFTMQHTTPKTEKLEDRYECEPKNSIPFLDISISVVEGKIDTDLFKKDTDRNRKRNILHK